MSKKDDNQIINTLNKIQGTLNKHKNILNKHGKRLTNVEETCTQLVSLVMENKADIREIKEVLKTKADKNDINRILDAIDNFAGRTKSNEEQITIGSNHLRRTDKRVDEVEADVKQIKPLVGIN